MKRHANDLKHYILLYFFAVWAAFSAFPLWGQSSPGEREGTFALLRNSGYELEDRNQLDSAVQLYRQALEIAQKTQDKYDLATIYTDLAITYRKKSEYVACKNFHEKAIEIAQLSGDQTMVGDNLHGIGSLYEQIGDYDKAVEYYLKALEISQHSGETEGVIVTLQNISKTYMQLNIKDLALHNIEQSLKMAHQTGSDSVTANVLHDYGEILVHFGENERALEKLNEALATYEKVGYKRFIASSLVYAGDVYSKIGKPEKAFEYFERALKFRANMDNYVLADLYFKHGQLSLAQGIPGKAKADFEMSMSIAAANEFKDLHQKNAESLYSLAKNAGDLPMALAHLQTSTRLKDNIFDVEKTKRIAEMQLKFDSEKQQRLLQALELKQYRLVFAGAVIIFVLVIGFLAWIAKISARSNRLLESKNREIQHQNIQLTESNEVLRQYAYVAAHDLKEPLRTICSFINLLEIKFGKTLEDKQAVEYMQLISSSAKRMNVLLTDLLEYSSIFHQKPGSDNVNPRAVLDETCINLKNLIDTKSASVTYPEHFPHLQMNRIHLVQILQNLIGNALKFTNGRKPEVNVSWKMEGKEVVFAVRDNGIGIGERHREKIFHLFFRANESAEFDGTGIGLSVCKSLTEKYGGRIWFQSVEHQGTTFFFAFPKEMVSGEETSVSERKAKVA